MSVVRPALLAAAALAAASWTSLALCGWGAGNLAILAREVCQREAMNQRLAVSQRTLEVKTQVVNDLIVGRVTLREAAERFRDLNALLHDGNDDLIGGFWVVSGEELLARHVLFWVEAERGDRLELAVALARLEDEYRQGFGHPPEPWAPGPFLPGNARP